MLLASSPSTLSPVALALFLVLSSPAVLQAQARYAPPRDTGYGSDTGYGTVPDKISCDTWDPIEMIESVNKERSQKGLQPIGFLESLNRAASYHSWDQAIHNEMTHSDWRGRGLGDRFRSAGCEDWTGVYENVAYGYPSIEVVMQRWMNSPGHRANILHTGITHFGTALWFSSKGTPYYTQSFAKIGDSKFSYPLFPSSVPGSCKTCGTVQDTSRSGPPEKGGNAMQPQKGDTGYGTAPSPSPSPPPKDTEYGDQYPDEEEQQPEPEPEPKEAPAPPKASESPDNLPDGDFTKTYETTPDSDLSRKYCKKAKKAPKDACVTITITKTGSRTNYHCKWVWKSSS
ncbi:MAG: CAP domain-containing protein [Piptocephalis tieghemiana]|nr:MAG: CAP domain-containing protein [Piptocephalis tieghemiana]